MRWTGPFCAAGNWCLGVWKRAEDDAEVVLAEYSAECRGSAVGSWSWENRVRGWRRGYGLRPERDRGADMGWVMEIRMMVGS